MTTLAIETATAACSVALLDDAGGVLARAHEVVGRGHAERLVPMIADLVAGRDAPSAILVDCGPGSFTGVRVGLAAARALALAWGAALAGYSSLGLLAAMAGEADADGAGPLAVAIPGGHGELFVRRFAGAEPVGPLASLTPAAAAAAVPDALVVGGGAAALVAARGHGRALDLLPDAGAAGRLPPGQRALAPSPLYGRAPDARPRAPAVAL